MGLFGKKKSGPTDRVPGDKDRYRFLRPVGEGGISVVGSYYDGRLNRVVALKELRKDSLDDDELTRFFINESKLLGYLDHPGVIPVFDTFLREDGRPCYTMKLCQGLPLSSLLESYEGPNRGPMPLQRALEIFTKLSESLAYVHDRGVLHLDLKPDNIMVGTYGEVMLLDWGSAKLFKSTEFYKYLEEHTPDTEVAYFEQERQGVTLGTPRYMSPEQAEHGREELTCASDVFSAGIVFYQMLTSCHPFPAQRPRELMEQIATLEPTPPHKVNHDIPVRLSEICLGMLHKSPRVRYQDFHAVLRDLDSYRGVGEAFPIRECVDGEMIFDEGDAGDFAFMVLDGEVEIIKQVSENELKVIATLGEGEIVGELAIISKLPRTAGARARGRTRIRILSKTDIDREMEKLSPWVSKMITGLSGRFIDLRDRLLDSERLPAAGK
jgi:serine/threonine-protein kinase